MTPDEYRDTLNRLELTHIEAAELLYMHPMTSVKAVVGPRIVALLKLLEHVGVVRYREIVGLPVPKAAPVRRGGAGSRTPAQRADRARRRAALEVH
jgi:hypothetical protein